jgi:impB/mucB/samB family C-terminal domain
VQSLSPSLLVQSASQCDEILDLCNGIDNTLIEDDDGTLQKSLSVENSLRNGTIRTKTQVLQIVEDLYRRLPLLLHDRKEWSEYPSLAYPTVIRVTARSSFDLIAKGRRDRSFTTRSQQSKFEGGRAICNDGLNASDAAAILRQSVTPLLHSLLFTSQVINVTRLNICVTNFQDICKITPTNQSRVRTLNAFISPPPKKSKP